MKKLNALLMGLSVLGLMIFASCGDDEDPEVTGTIDVTISGLPAGGAAEVTVTGPGGFSETITGTTQLTGLALGAYTFNVTAAEANDNRYVSDQDLVSVNLTDATPEAVTINYAEFTQVNGIVGTWVSAGADVAPLLVNLFAVDSIVAVFEANQTYTVSQYAGGSTQPLTLTGTYTQNLTSVGSIWEIVVDQTTPAALTSEGIFDINVSANPDEMRYEIAQTSPDIGAIPADPAGGFGSTSGGVLGDANVQVYKRRAY